MQISDAGLNLIKQFESCRLHAYLPTPNDVPTIGYGHTAGVRMGDVIDQETADAYLREDVSEAEQCVNDYVDVPLTQQQFDACVCLAFNIGTGAFRNSTLCRLLNQGDFDGAARQFARWNKQNGAVLAGLTRRRSAEAILFATRSERPDTVA